MIAAFKLGKCNSSIAADDNLNSIIIIFIIMSVTHG